MNDGTYKGHVADYGAATNSKGQPQIVVKFKIQTPEGDQFLNWYGFFSEKSTPFTLKTLLLLGFTGNDISVLSQGVASNSLSTTQEYDLAIAKETWEGQTRTKIKFISLPGSQGIKNAVTGGEATKVLAKFNADLAALKAQQGTSFNPGF